MKKYKHPAGVTRKTGDEPILVSFTSGDSEVKYVVRYAGADQLLALGFEEVVEEKKQDWKLDLYESLEGLFGKGLDELEEFLAFRKKLEKHMPKQKKFTIREVEDYYRKIEEGLDKGVVEHNKENKIDVLIISAITGFLRDHGQLEE